MICTKRCYDSKKQAREASRRNGARIRVYQCEECWGKWHVTNQDKSGRDRRIFVTEASNAR